MKLLKQPKLKTIVRNNRISIASDLDNEIIPIRGDNYDNPTGTVNSFSDVFKLRYVYEGTPGVAPTVNENGEILGGSGTDITDFFLFDDGQRDSLYDTAALVKLWFQNTYWYFSTRFRLLQTFRG